MSKNTQATQATQQATKKVVSTTGKFIIVSKMIIFGLIGAGLGFILNVMMKAHYEKVTAVHRTLYAFDVWSPMLAFRVMLGLTLLFISLGFIIAAVQVAVGGYYDYK